MFGSKKQPAIRSLIGEGTLIEGVLRFSDGLRIDGEIVGDVIASADTGSILVISEKAKITGTVKASHVIINGTIIGPVESTQLLELQPKAHIRGDILYVSLEMHQGATIEGALHKIGGSPTNSVVTPLQVASEEKPALKLAMSKD